MELFRKRRTGPSRKDLAAVILILLLSQVPIMLPGPNEESEASEIQMTRLKKGIDLKKNLWWVL